MYEPVFEGEIEGYTVNYLTKNFWRVQRTMTREDAMQESYCVFLRCKDKYQVEDAPHFMALYKTALFREFTDLAWADSEQAGAEHVSSTDVDIAGDTDNDGYLATLIRQAPAEVKAVLNLFLSAPQEVLDIAMAGYWSKDNHIKLNSSKRISQLLGVKGDAIEQTRKFFSV